MLYGGEPYLKKYLIHDILDLYPSIQPAIQTNGTMLNSDISKRILDKDGIIFVTLESFDYEKQILSRYMSKKTFSSILDYISLNNKKNIILVKNISKETTDLVNYYKMANLLGLKVDLFPIIDNSIGELKTEIPNEAIKFLLRKIDYVIKPKIRILTDGTVTRDMRGIYNIGSILNYTDKYKDSVLPLPSCIEKCKYKETCFASKIFPHFVKDVNPDGESFFICNLARRLYEYNSI